MVYVALSRVRSLEGLQLIGFDPNSIKSHPKVLDFYSKLVVYKEASQEDIQPIDRNNNIENQPQNDQKNNQPGNEVDWNEYESINKQFTNERQIQNLNQFESINKQFPNENQIQNLNQFESINKQFPNENQIQNMKEYNSNTPNQMSIQNQDNRETTKLQQKPSSQNQLFSHSNSLQNLSKGDFKISLKRTFSQSKLLGNFDRIDKSISIPTTRPLSQFEKIAINPQNLNPASSNRATLMSETSTVSNNSQITKKRFIYPTKPTTNET